MTLNLLSQAKQVKTVFAFRNDTELDGKLKLAQSYNKVLRDFPINQLLSANDLESIAKAIDAIFSQFKKIKHQDSYPI